MQAPHEAWAGPPRRMVHSKRKNSGKRGHRQAVDTTRRAIHAPTRSWTSQQPARNSSSPAPHQLPTQNATQARAHGTPACWPAANAHQEKACMEQGAARLRAKASTPSWLQGGNSVLRVELLVQNAPPFGSREDLLRSHTMPETCSALGMSRRRTHTRYKHNSNSIKEMQACMHVNHHAMQGSAKRRHRLSTQQQRRQQCCRRPTCCSARSRPAPARMAVGSWQLCGEHAALRCVCAALRRLGQVQ